MQLTSGLLICGTKFTGQNGTISSQPLNNSSIDLTDLITNNYNLLSSSIFQSSQHSPTQRRGLQRCLELDFRSYSRIWQQFSSCSGSWDLGGLRTSSISFGSSSGSYWRFDNWHEEFG